VLKNLFQISGNIWKNFMNKIVLIGFRATGKTTTGQKLAQVLKWKFIDLDEEIQKRAKKTIKEIVEEGGWEEFRKRERELMREIADLKNVVIALGGGGVLHKEEMKKLKENSLVVWLKTSEKEIIKRMKKDQKTTSQRPDLSNLPLEEEVKKILKEREPLYKIYSDLEIDTTNLSHDKVIEKILRQILLVT